MNKSIIDRKFGREAFGANPAGYHAARPGYPDWVFEILCERCGLGPGVAAFEIGAGTGTATRRLLDLGANPLVAIEPDNRMAAFLRTTIVEPALTVLPSPFENVALPDASFDLGISATSFHWLNEDLALTKVAKALRAGGWWAMVSNEFGDPDRADPFHEATRIILDGPASPSVGSGNISFALDTDARLAAIKNAQAFDEIIYRSGSWSLILNPDQIVNLYSTYSNINIREDRENILIELHRIAKDEFHGCVTRNMITTLYIARRY
jgi:SAM-dependent methyltransferase